MGRTFTHLTGARLAVFIATFLFVSPFFIPRSVLGWGFSFFFSWAALCVAAVLAGRMLIWAFLSVSALATVSLDWWLNGPPMVDDFGYGALDAIALFSGTALVVAGTGVLSVTLTALRAQQNGS